MVLASARRRVRLWLALPLLAGLLCLAAPPARAEVNYILAYQGRLDDAAGHPVNATLDINFVIYDAASGGTVHWNQTKSVTVVNGLYRVVLGETNSMVMDRRSDYYLQIQVDGEEPMTPRTRLSAAMFTIRPNLGQQTILVAKQNGDYTTITAALAAITDAAESNRYMIKVGPGVYEERITMKPWVDIQGSGRQATVIQGPGYDSGDPVTGVVVGANNCTISDLAVVADGDYTNDVAVGVYNLNASPTLRNVAVSALGATLNHIAVHNEGVCAPQFRLCSLAATGGTLAMGMRNVSGCAPYLELLQVVAKNGSSANYGMFTGGANVTSRDCSFAASGTGTSSNIGGNNDSGTESHIGSRFSASGGVSARAFSVYDCATVELNGCRMAASEGSNSSYGFSASIEETNSAVTLHKCQVEASSTLTTTYVQALYAGTNDVAYTMDLSLDTVRAVATGGENTNGLWFNAARVTGSNVWAKALAATTLNLGMSAQDSQVTLVNSTLIADGGPSAGDAVDCTGADLEDSRVQLMNTAVVANRKGSLGDGYGVHFHGIAFGRDLELTNCQVSGETQGVLHDASSSFWAGSSQLNGGFSLTGSGSRTCVACYRTNGGLAALNTTCVP